MIRRLEIYKNAINSFNVENNIKYKASNGVTYCNFFAQDVMNHKNILAPLPKGVCSAMLTIMFGNKFSKWRSVNYITAQNRANLGFPTVGITNTHIVVIRPNNGHTISVIKELKISQAGKVCHEDVTIDYAWIVTALPSVKFYSYYD